MLHLCGTDATTAKSFAHCWNATFGLVSQRGLAPVPTPRENSVKTMWFRRSRDAVAAFAAPVLDVPATSSHRPGEASAANPLASRPLSRSRPSPAPNCSGWHSAKRAARTCIWARTARTCRRSLNEVRGNASSNPIHARTALLGSGKRKNSSLARLAPDSLQVPAEVPPTRPSRR